MDDLTRLARTRTDLDGPGWVPLGSARFCWVPLSSAGFRWVPLGSAGFYYTDVFNDRLLGANLQLVPGCYTLAA